MIKLCEISKSEYLFINVYNTAYYFLEVNKWTLTSTSGQELTSKDTLKSKQTAHHNYNTCLKLHYSKMLLHNFVCECGLTRQQSKSTLHQKVLLFQYNGCVKYMMYTDSFKDTHLSTYTANLLLSYVSLPIIHRF